jgi:hypothetical protein
MRMSGVQILSPAPSFSFFSLVFKACVKLNELIVQVNIKKALEGLFVC